MPRQRLPQNKGLPLRWRFTHGGYYYQVPADQRQQWDGKYLFLLGKPLPEAYKLWASKLEARIEAKTIGDLLDRYALQVIPTKAPRTQVGNRQCLNKIRSVFGDLPLTSVKPQHIYQYVDKRNALVSAHREVALLSHAFTKAVEWGYIDRHPFKGEVRLGGEKPRTRYVEDWEVIECLSLSSTRKKGSIIAIQAYIRVKLLTGLRQGDLLRLKMSNLGPEGIALSTSKTRKAIVYEWTPELRQAVEEAKAARPTQVSEWLFCSKTGDGYVNEKDGTAWGWHSMWQRFMARVLTETKVTERFTEHDLRAKCASDATTLDQAKALLAHADSRLTERVYRRRPEKITPSILRFE